MGGRGSSSGRGGGFAGVYINDFPDPIQPLKASALSPISGGSMSENEEAKKIRSKVAQNMINYAISRDSEGRKISPERAATAVFRTKQQQFEAAKISAIEHSYGNKSLYKEKMQLEVSRNNDLNSRYQRISEYIKSAPSTAKYWLSYDSSRNYNDGNLEKYIDGKSKNPKIYV